CLIPACPPALLRVIGCAASKSLRAEICTIVTNKRNPIRPAPAETFNCGPIRADESFGDADTFLFASHRHAMIHLTRLNNQPLMVNSDLIKFVERAPDTVLTLISGEKIVVLEAPQEVLDRVVGFRRTILAGPSLAQSDTPSPESAKGGARDGQE